MTERRERDLTNGRPLPFALAGRMPRTGWNLRLGRSLFGLVSLLAWAGCVASSWAGDSSDSPAETDLQQAIQTILAIGHEGAGNSAAVSAMQTLNAATRSQIPELLMAMDQANPVAANYLRGAVESALRRDGEFPLASVREYLDDRGHSSASRVFAFDLIRRHDSSLAEQIVPQFLDDPSLPLRRFAVKRLLSEAESQTPQAAIGTLGYALSFARDVDQITAARDALATHNVQVDLARQLGFLQKWRLAAPFDHTQAAHFETPLGPELNLAEIDLAATYEGKKNGDQPTTVAWKTVQTSDPTGVVNLNEEIGKVKSAICYAFGEFESAAEQEVVLKIGCINATKVWLNGQLLISEEVYHNGMDPDQFSAAAHLKQGKNQILVKICQNDQQEPWAQEWMFQVRICDPAGKSVLPVPPPATPQ